MKRLILVAFIILMSCNNNDDILVIQSECNGMDICPVPDWQFTNQTRCYVSSWGASIGLQEEEVEDMNPDSPYFGKKFWLIGNYSHECTVNVNCDYLDRIDGPNQDDCIFGVEVSEPAPPGLRAFSYHFPNGISTNILYTFGSGT